MEKLFAESDEAWALFDTTENHYCWCNPVYQKLWGPAPANPWTLFGLPQQTLTGRWQDYIVKLTLDQHRVWVHCREQNLVIYREAFHNLPAGLVITHIDDAAIVDLNSTAQQLSGYKVGDSTKMFWHSQQQRSYYLKHLKQHGQVKEAYFPYLDAQGEKVDNISSIGAFSYRGQNYLVGNLGPPPPDSMRYRIEAELLQRIFEYAPALIVVSDDNGRIQRVNRAVCNTSGYSAEELHNQVFYKLIPPEEQPRVEMGVQQCLTEEDVTYVENHWLTKHGDKRLLNWSNTRLGNTFNDEVLHVGIARDITEQRMVETRFRTLVDNAPDAILEIDSRGQIIFINPEAREIFGNFLHTSILSRVHEDDWPRVAEEMQKKIIDVQCRMLDQQHGWRWFACKGQSGILIVRDITLARQNSEQRHLQRMNEVTAGLAEEFHILQQKLQVVLDKADLNQARSILKQANELTERLRSLNQEATFKPERATLETMLKDTVTQITRNFSKVRMQLDLQTQDSWLSGGRAQLEHLLLNLGLSHPGKVLHLVTLPGEGHWVELRISGANLQTGQRLDQAVVISGDPLRIFLPLTP